MSPRTGRPKKGETRRGVQITIKLNDDEMQMLNECAERKGKTRTDVVVEGVRMVKQELDEQKK